MKVEMTVVFQMEVTDYQGEIDALRLQIPPETLASIEILNDADHLDAFTGKVLAFETIDATAILED